MGKPQTYKTTCSYCGVGCGIVIHKSPSGKLRLEGDKDNPVNRGKLCSKGRNLLHVVKDTSDRLLHPLYRQNINDSFERLSWDDAMNKTTSKISRIISDYGSDAVGFYVSGQCLTEEYYVANKLVKGFIGTNNIDTNSRLCMSSAVMGYKLALGDDIVPASFDDIELADCFLISGANPAWCHPILFRRLEDHKQKNPNTRVIVIDPRETDTCSIADVHLQLKPGTDITLANAIAKVLIEEDYIDYNFISNHTNGFKQLVKSLDKLTLTEAAQECGVKEEYIIETAKFIGQSKGFMTLWAMGLNQSSEGVNKNLSLINLSLITGQIGKPGTGPLSLTGQPNAMGGREVGGMATLLAAHHNLANADHREKVQQFWKSKKIKAKPGLTATEMIEALEKGKLKVLWIICTNPLVSLPDLNRVEKALKKAELVIVQDISRRSDSLDFAHMVLPAAGWMEKEGAMTNSDRRVTYLPKVVDAPGEARADVEILTDFAKRMGYGGFDYKNSEEIFNEHKLLTTNTPIDISGLSYAQLKDTGSKQWPVTSESPNGTERLFTNKQFCTTDKKAVIHTVESTALKTWNTLEYAFTLTTGRIRDQWHTMTRTGKVNALGAHISKPLLSIHPADAENLGITSGDIVEISNKFGKTELPAKLDSTTPQSTLFLPMHWGKVGEITNGRTNNLTSFSIDPISKQPEFKYSKVNIKKKEVSMRHIAIVGAGAAAYRFITEYRKYNKKDNITVFTNETKAFYNRVRLPEYINESIEWNSLQKISDNELEHLRISVKSETWIKSINTDKKQILDRNNSSFTFDTLILATGSKAIKPNINLNSLSGVFTMRYSKDADNLKQYITEKSAQSASIIGGGILGIELADSLNELGLDVTVISRGSQLLSKNIDATAASLLANKISEKGIRLLLNKTVENINNKDDHLKLIVLSDTSTVTSNIVVYAIGTKPNLSLAPDAGLAVNEGVLVNEFMQTSDPNIFAIGELAEHKGSRVGITMGAEEQAVACVNFLIGNYFEHYRNSVSVNILKCNDIDLCSIGTITSNASNVEEVVLLDSKRNFYKKCLIKDDRLIGTILLGDIGEYREFLNLIRKGTELGDKRDELLRSSESKQEVEGDIVCSCNQVGRGNLEYFINNGCSSFEGLMVITKAGTGCGSCKPEIKKMIEQRTVIS